MKRRFLGNSSGDPQEITTPKKNVAHTQNVVQLTLSPSVHAMMRYIAFSSTKKGTSRYAASHTHQFLRGARRRGGAIPHSVARSRRTATTSARLYLNSTPPELRPTGEVSLRQYRAVGVSRALPGGHEQRGAPPSSTEVLHCAPSSVSGDL